ncbi:hypothetical protein P7C73_g2943, partial [Tremellales sp. Uapishka_1]
MNPRTQGSPSSEMLVRLALSVGAEHLAYLGAARETNQIVSRQLRHQSMAFMQSIRSSLSVDNVIFGLVGLSLCFTRDRYGPVGCPADTQVCISKDRLFREGLEGFALEEATALYEGLDTTWLATIASMPSRPRVQAGNFILRHALICDLSRHGLGVPRGHPRIRQSVTAIIELLAETVTLSSATACLMYPTLIAGEMCNTDEREQILQFIDIMKQYVGCFDIDSAELLLKEVWRRRDAGEDIGLAEVRGSNKSLSLVFV